MNSKPYIGITGPTTKEEVLHICKYFEEFGFYNNSSHNPMIGILASYKTLNNIKVENRRYPKLEDVPELMKVIKHGTFKTIHYNTREFDSLDEQVSKLLSTLPENSFPEGIQLNVDYLPINKLGKIKNNFPNLKIIFQANSEVLNLGSEKEIAKFISSYNTLIDYVLIDGSRGKGKELDVNYSSKLAKEIKNLNPNLSIGFAGGFNKDNTFVNCTNLISHGNFNFSIDAEGGLRDKLSKKYGDDLLNLDEVKAYIQLASLVFK